MLGCSSAVEDELRASVASADPFVTEAARHLVEAGGKRFRPLLVALGAQFGDPTGAAGRAGGRGGGADPPGDALPRRRDGRGRRAARARPSANSRWGNSVAILVGDYLFARAADIAADLGTEAVRLQARTFARLVHGQIAETVGPRDGDDPVAHYLHVIAEKTGSLIATSARFGGMFGGAAAGAHRGARRVRRDDRRGLPALRRPARHRLASRCSRARRPAPTCARACRRCRCSTRWPSDDADAASVRLREILAAGPVTDDALHAEALGLLRESPALKRARETVRGYAEEARAPLAPLPDGPARRALESLCDFIADRTS